MAPATLGKTIEHITDQLNRFLSREWVFPASARFGELQAAFALYPNIAIDIGFIRSLLEQLITAKPGSLFSTWEAECRHVRQMVGSGYGLTYEELLALLTSLSELAFVKTCLSSLGLTHLPLSGTPSEPEVRECLIAQRKVYPHRWSLPHSIVLEFKDHWWWTKP